MTQVQPAERILPLFPYFGGKRSVADEVWRRFGNPPIYVEPFCGAAAVLLARPKPRRGIEIVNDVDGYICNAFRAIRDCPVPVLRNLARCQTDEIDLNAWNRWLIERRESLTERLRDDPFYSNTQVATRWLWGACLCMGSVWSRREQRLSWRQSHRVPQPAEILRVHHRLKGVRVMAGDWTRVVTEARLGYDRQSAIFLDPPYALDMRDKDLYAEDRPGLSDEVRAWAIREGKKRHRRIALCGYQGEHAMPKGWKVYKWVAHGGFGNSGNGRAARTASLSGSGSHQPASNDRRTAFDRPSPAVCPPSPRWLAGSVPPFPVICVSQCHAMALPPVILNSVFPSVFRFPPVLRSSSKPRDLRHLLQNPTSAKPVLSPRIPMRSAKSRFHTFPPQPVIP